MTGVALFLALCGCVGPGVLAQEVRRLRARVDGLQRRIDELERGQFEDLAYDIARRWSEG